VAQMVRYVIESNYSGVHSDFEMGQGAVNSSHPAVPAYREFVSPVPNPSIAPLAAGSEARMEAC